MNKFSKKIHMKSAILHCVSCFIQFFHFVLFIKHYLLHIIKFGFEYMVASVFGLRSFVFTPFAKLTRHFPGSLCHDFFQLWCVYFYCFVMMMNNFCFFGIKYEFREKKTRKIHYQMFHSIQLHSIWIRWLHFSFVSMMVLIKWERSLR